MEPTTTEAHIDRKHLSMLNDRSLNRLEPYVLRVVAEAFTYWLRRAERWEPTLIIEGIENDRDRIRTALEPLDLPEDGPKVFEAAAWAEFFAALQGECYGRKMTLEDALNAWKRGIEADGPAWSREYPTKPGWYFVKRRELTCSATDLNTAGLIYKGISIDDADNTKSLAYVHPNLLEYFGPIPEPPWEPSR